MHFGGAVPCTAVGEQRADPVNVSLAAGRQRRRGRLGIIGLRRRLRRAGGHALGLAVQALAHGCSLAAAAWDSGGHQVVLHMFQAIGECVEVPVPSIKRLSAVCPSAGHFKNATANGCPV